MKKLYITLLSIFAACQMSVHAESFLQESNGVNVVLEAQGAVEIGISVSGQELHITNAAGKSITVYSITGSKVLSASIDSNDKTIALNVARGWYIVKVGDITRKVFVG